MFAPAASIGNIANESIRLYPCDNEALRVLADELALLVKPHPKGITLNVAVPLRVTGPLRNPQYALDEAAAARRVGGVLASIVFPPALIAAFADIGYESSGCLPGKAQQSTASAAASGGKIVDDASATAAKTAGPPQTRRARFWIRLARQLAKLPSPRATPR